MRIRSALLRWWAIATIALAMGIARPSAASGPASCGVETINRMMRAVTSNALAEGDLGSAFARLADQTPGTYAGVHRLFLVAPEPEVADGIRQLLAFRTNDEARKVFELVTAFQDEQAVLGVSRAARMAEIDGVTAGYSIHSLAGRQIFSPAAKEQFFRDLLVIANHEGAPRLLKRAGQQLNLGALVEVAVDARLARTGEYGALTHVDFDQGGALLAFDKIDTRTATHALQAKSTTSFPLLRLDAEIALADLQLLKAQAGQLGLQPALVSNVAFDPPLQEACASLGILQLPSWVAIP